MPRENKKLLLLVFSVNNIKSEYVFNIYYFVLVIGYIYICPIWLAKQSKQTFTKVITKFHTLFSVVWGFVLVLFFWWKPNQYSWVLLPSFTHLRALQVTQDNLALPDLLVPLVHAVVGVLQSLVEAKKLVDFPHIMEMNLWT